MRAVLVLGALALGACTAQQRSDALTAAQTAEKVGKIGCTVADLVLTVEPIAAAGCTVIKALP